MAPAQPLPVGKPLKSFEKATLRMIASEYSILSKQSEAMSLETFCKTSKLISGISVLIHALQRERGGSCLFLGSKGEVFSGELVSLIECTEDQMPEFLNALRAMEESERGLQDRFRFFSKVAHCVHLLAGLGELRVEVREMRVAPSVVLEGYGEIVSGLLSIVFEAADAALDPRISKVLVALFHFMEGKEFAGQERATGAAGFGLGEFSVEARQSTMHLINAQERSFEVFEDFADDCSMTAWQNVGREAAQTDIERLRRVACMHEGQVADSALGERWFRVTTQRIDSMKIVEESLIRHFETLCRRKLSEAMEMLDQDRAAVGRWLQEHERERESFVVFVGESGAPHLGEKGEYTTQALNPQLGRSLVDIVREQAVRLQSLSDDLISAKAALEERKVIEKAKGLLMRHRQMSESEAHKMLREMSMNQGKQMGEVADALISMEKVWA